MRPIVGIHHDFNLYAYVKNDPPNQTNPSGREAGATYSALYKAESKYGMQTGGRKLTESEAEMIVDALPLIGDAKGNIDAYNDPSVLNVVGATIGLIPIIGDGAKQLVKKLGDSNPIHSAETIGNRTDISKLSDSELLQSHQFWGSGKSASWSDETQPEFYGEFIELKFRSRLELVAAAEA